MNLFSKYSLVVGLALLCVIIGCGETEDPLHPSDLNDRHFRTIAETKIPPVATVPAAPQAPPTDGTPFVRSVTYYTDWKLTDPITGTVAPGTTFFTKIVFSEPMTFTAADDKTARPILYYQIDGKRTRYRIAKHGARGEAFESGDAKPKGSGTQTFVCKYTVPAETTGTFKTSVGKLNTDKDGNSLARFYVHTDALRLAVPRSADIQLSKDNIDENNAPDTVIGTFETQAGERFSYRMIKGSRYYFQVNENNALIAKRSFDHEAAGSFEITIRAKDRDTRQSLTQVFTIFVNDINEAPTGLSLFGTTFTEGDGEGTLIGTLQAIDEDAEDTHTFVLLAGGDYFEIAGNTLKLLQTLSSSQAIEIVVSDSGGLVDSERFTIELRIREVFTEDTTSTTDTDDTSEPSEPSEELDCTPPYGLYRGECVPPIPDPDDGFQGLN